MQMIAESLGLTIPNIWMRKNSIWNEWAESKESTKLTCKMHFEKGHRQKIVIGNCHQSQSKQGTWELQLLREKMCLEMCQIQRSNDVLDEHWTSSYPLDSRWRGVLDCFAISWREWLLPLKKKTPWPGPASAVTNSEAGMFTIAISFSLTLSKEFWRRPDSGGLKSKSKFPLLGRFLQFHIECVNNSVYAIIH